MYHHPWRRLITRRLWETVNNCTMSMLAMSIFVVWSELKPCHVICQSCHAVSTSLYSNAATTAAELHHTAEMLIAGGGDSVVGEILILSHRLWRLCHKGGNFVMGWETSIWRVRLCNVTLAHTGNWISGALCTLLRPHTMYCVQPLPNSCVHSFY